MISPIPNSSSTLAGAVPSPSRKLHSHHRAAEPGPAPVANGANPASLPQKLGPTSETNNVFTAAPSAILDASQAAAAIQHTGLLMQAQPSLALRAQANVSSQSVQRLLQ